MSAEAIIAIVSVGVVLLLAALGFMWRNLGAQIGAVRTDLRQEANEAHARIESNIKATENRLSLQITAVKTDLEQQIETVKSDVTATRSELTAAIDKQTDRIVALHRDLRGLGERVARVEASG